MAFAATVSRRSTRTLALMEDRDYFTLRNRAMLVWLASVAMLALAVASLFPPSFWLCGLGIPLAVVGMLAHSARTDQWYTWQNWEPKLSWFEGWAASTGVTLAIVPLVGILVRAWLF